MDRITVGNTRLAVPAGTAIARNKIGRFYRRKKTGRFLHERRQIFLADSNFIDRLTCRLVV